MRSTEHCIESATPRFGTQNPCRLFRGLSHRRIMPGSVALQFTAAQRCRYAQRPASWADRGASARAASGMAAAMLAHEIKNPLSGIRGAAQLLELSASAQDRNLTHVDRRRRSTASSCADRFVCRMFSDTAPARAMASRRISIQLHRARPQGWRSPALPAACPMDRAVRSLAAAGAAINRDALAPDFDQPAEECGGSDAHRRRSTHRHAGHRLSPRHVAWRRRPRNARTRAPCRSRSRVTDNGPGRPRRHLRRPISSIRSSLAKPEGTGAWPRAGRQADRATMAAGSNAIAAPVEPNCPMMTTLRLLHATVAAQNEQA